MKARGRKSIEHSGGAVLALLLGIALLVSACLMCVALQSRNGLLLGWFTLIPLFLSIRVLTPLRAMFAGAFWGLCLFLFSAASVEAPFAPTIPALVLLCVFPGAYAWLGAALTRRVGFSPLLLGLGWIGVELALMPLGVRNGLLAGALGHGLIVRTMGYLAGYFVVAFIVAYVNASLLAMLREVCAAGGVTRIAREPAGSPKRLFPTELPTCFFQFLRPSQPRAPPVC